MRCWSLTVKVDFPLIFFSQVKYSSICTRGAEKCIRLMFQGILEGDSGCSRLFRVLREVFNSKLVDKEWKIQKILVKSYCITYLDSTMYSKFFKTWSACPDSVNRVLQFYLDRKCSLTVLPGRRNTVLQLYRDGEKHILNISCSINIL